MKQLQTLIYIERERQADRDRERQTDRQTDKQTDTDIESERAFFV